MVIAKVVLGVCILMLSPRIRCFLMLVVTSFWFGSRYWCMKEAYVKAIGIGFGFDLQRAEFFYECANMWSASAHLRLDGVHQPDWCFYLTRLEKNHWVRKCCLQVQFLLTWIPFLLKLGNHHIFTFSFFLSFVTINERDRSHSCSSGLSSHFLLSP
jgi:hypothetical protein